MKVCKTVMPLMLPQAVPPVSVIVPVTSDTYAKRLDRCFTALRASQYVPDIEILVVWLGTRDFDFGDAWEPLLKHEACVVVADPDKDAFCLARARNVGARCASHDVLVFVDADVMVQPDTMVRAVAALTVPRFVTSLTLMLDKKDVPIKVEPRGFGGFLMIRRSDFEEVRGYDEAYRGWGFEDCDLVDRLVWNGRQHYNLSEQEGVVVLHQWHPPMDGASRRRWTCANMRRYGNVVTPFRNPHGWGKLYLPL